jgi:hypothetical protein|tara:strand:- start:952 stop:1425 length:474 start_codon:yes stop_codon:yes gene_type:complete
MSNLNQFNRVNSVFKGTDSITLPSGTTAQRVSGAGKLRFNTTTKVPEAGTGSSFIPFGSFQHSVDSISPSSVSYSGSGNFTIVITGVSFTSGMTVKFIDTGGNEISADTVTWNSATQITAVVAQSGFNGKTSPFDVKASKPIGKQDQLDNSLTVSGL